MIWEACMYDDDDGDDDDDHGGANDDNEIKWGEEES
jgi:hypothetical protein